MMEKRILWVDYVKVIACVLVALGHFFQSMTKSAILPDSDLYEWFNMTIYYFHVPLFFICSGFLYQKFSRVRNITSWVGNVLKKGFVLGVPYFVFSTATWILKTVFSGSVNDRIGGLGSTLFLYPTSPYWYLYCLFFIFLITPTFSGARDTVITLIMAMAAKILVSIGGGQSIYAVSVVCQNEIWFVIGMCICVFDVELTGRKIFASICGVLFLGWSVFAYVSGNKNSLFSFALGVLACTAVVMLVASYQKLLGKMRMMNYLSGYTMPVFLMHTLFAAPARAVLLKVNISDAAIHIIVGLAISFIGPITAAVIMKKTKYLEFLLYPGKFVKIK